jgi:hypothetical protein
MDVIGFISLMLLVVIFVPTLVEAMSKANYAAPIHNSDLILTPSFLVALTFLQIMMYSISPWWAQKLFSARSKRVAYISSLTSALLISLIYVAFILLGCLLRANNIGVMNSQDALSTIFMEYVPYPLKWFFVATVILIGTSTICGVWSSISGMISVGFLGKSNNSSPVINYYIFGILAVISYLIAIKYIDNVLYCAILAVCQICSIYFAVMTIFFLGKSRLSAVISICLTFLANIAIFFYFGNGQEYVVRWFSVAVPIMFLSGTLSLVNYRYVCRPWLQSKAIRTSPPDILN